MKILVVEDDIKIANSIKKGLEQENHIVDVSYDGEEGYDLASSETYDIIILDLMLPSMPGEEICTSLRADKITTPILMLTAKSQLRDKVDGLNIGADDYLTKPFEFEELLARVKAISRRPRQYTDELLAIGELSLDLTNSTVKINGLDVLLTKKEFALLEYLMRHKDHVMSKDQIMESVWSFESDILPNTVEVYIRYLRQKIDRPFKTNYIKTVRGFGYKVSE